MTTCVTVVNVTVFNFSRENLGPVSETFPKSERERRVPVKDS